MRGACPLHDLTEVGRQGKDTSRRPCHVFAHVRATTPTSGRPRPRQGNHAHVRATTPTSGQPRPRQGDHAHVTANKPHSATDTFAIAMSLGRTLTFLSPLVHSTSSTELSGAGYCPTRRGWIFDQHGHVPLGLREGRASCTTSRRFGSEEENRKKRRNLHLRVRH
jgi:hypothetical protein